MKSYNNIFFLRHLKTQNNDLCIISGQSDSEIIQKKDLEIDLSRFDKIYCSTSERCIKTIELLRNKLTKIDIIYDERLQERNMGLLEGMFKKNVEKKYSELFIEGSFKIFETPPQGESYKCFIERVKDFYIDFLSVNQGNKILICSHNQTLKLLRLLILEKDITYESWLEYSFENGKIINLE